MLSLKQARRMLARQKRRVVRAAFEWNSGAFYKARAEFIRRRGLYSACWSRESGKTFWLMDDALAADPGVGSWYIATKHAEGLTYATRPTTSFILTRHPIAITYTEVV
jgi:hypothetical protein